MTPLGAVLSDPAIEIILHSGSHDIVSLDRDWGFRNVSLFDTSIAAAFTGVGKLGLANVLETVLGVSIPKQKKLQRSDWSIRPLGEQALAYAASDVLHLQDLRNALEQKLRDLGRMDWVAEECERLAQLRYEPPDLDDAVFRVKGWRKLDGRGLAILKTLVDYREDQAIRMGRPHFRVIPDMALFDLARNPDTDLRKVRGLGRFVRGGRANGIREAIAEGRSSTPPSPPDPPKKRRLSRSESAAVGRRLGRLKAWRTAEGKRLLLDPLFPPRLLLLWPISSLKRLAQEPDDLKSELRAPEVRRWQRDRTEFADSLREVLAGRL